MHSRKMIAFIIVALFLFTGLVFSAVAQHREYYIFGKILDTKKQPIAKVEISLRDIVTSRGYRFSTNKKGEFKFAGLPHGIYEVTISKVGYMTKNDEWRFETPQDRMQKVEIPTIVLVSEEVFQEAERLKLAQSELKEAAEKVRLGDFDGAIPILKKMLESNPKDPNALYLLGICYVKKEMVSEAIPVLNEVTIISPSFASAYQYLGMCYQQLDDLNKALESYQKALDLDPENVDTLYNFGLVLFEMNRIDEALVNFEKSLTLKPDEPEFLEMAGRCYIHRGDFLKAIEYLEKAKSGYTDQEKIEFLNQLIKKLKEQIKRGYPYPS